MNISNNQINDFNINILDSVYELNVLDLSKNKIADCLNISMFSKLSECNLTENSSSLCNEGCTNKGVCVISCDN
jgi:Leucine-rich repeat (LRR) protein